MTYKKVLYIFVILLVAVFLGQTVLAGFAKNQALAVSFIDVGQGDATLINYIGDYQVLIDGGPNGDKLISQISKEIPPLDGKIEVVVLTHPDKDHYQGLIDLLGKYEVGLFVYNGTEDDAESFKQLTDMLREKNVRTEMAMEGSDIQIGKYLKFAIFNPDEMSSDGKEKNRDSIVVRMDFGKNSFLFTGDAEFETEKDLLNDGEDVDVDFLKVGHHGSKNATSDEFLQRVTPKYSIISVGKNSYGHPTDEALGRLKDAGSAIIRTDERGTIDFTCESPKDECLPTNI